jgi:maltooligosyltrehalose trehalohydrolase
VKVLTGAAPQRRRRSRASASSWQLTLGANVEPNGVHFRVWAPAAQRVDVVLYGERREERHPLAGTSGGYHTGVVRDAGPGTRYRFRVDGEVYADPASRAQPEGVHGPSEVVDPNAFRWSDEEWRGITPGELVIYELHVGTFTTEGTFDSAIARLGDLAALGVTAIEVMPIATFAGARNWGYDGVALYAPAAVYGGPDAFKRFVDAAHRSGLAVILDVVYNHFGPNGNTVKGITGGQFFTERHKTPWGDAINYDGPESAAVRDFVLQNALYWAHEFHVDGLRLDATHAIFDDSTLHIVQEIADQLHRLEPSRVVIAEDDRNERRLVLPPEQHGFGVDAVWADDLHHQLRRLTCGDAEGYFASYTGSIDDVVTTLRKGWFYEGQWAAHRAGARGTPADGLPPRAFVHCVQNHDQVGNRAFGDRINAAVSPAVYRALSTLLLVSPYTPLLWMGQEWAASTPFLYFTDHDEEIGRRVSAGRREEFKQFSAFSDPAAREEIPDPQAARTFIDSRLRWEERCQPMHAGVLALYTSLIALRRAEPALRHDTREGFAVTALDDRALALRRAADEHALLAVVNFGESLRASLQERVETRPPAGRRWCVVLATEEERFGGDGHWGHLDADAGIIELTTPGAVVLRSAT